MLTEAVQQSSLWLLLFLAVLPAVYTRLVAMWPPPNLPRVPARHVTAAKTAQSSCSPCDRRQNCLMFLLVMWPPLNLPNVPARYVTAAKNCPEFLLAMWPPPKLPNVPARHVTTAKLFPQRRGSNIVNDKCSSGMYTIKSSSIILDC